MFVCFENLTINCLDYKPLHPSRNIDFRHNIRTTLYGFIDYTICDGGQHHPPHLKKLPNHEVIEYLRIKHEELYGYILTFLKYQNPQMFFHIIVEIGLMIVHSYFILSHI